MKLYEKLQTAKSEEDVKDIYVKALNLKGYHKGLVDIQSPEIWFEAKGGDNNSVYEMFTQLLHYVQRALDRGDEVPPFLSVIDKEKAALMKSTDILPFLAKKTIKWGKSASSYSLEALEIISAHIGAHLIIFNIATHEDEFISTIKNAIKNGDIIRTQITPNNLKLVFDKWVKMIGSEISGVSEKNYALLFFADIMHDGTVSTHKNLPAELLHQDGEPRFLLNNHVYKLSSCEGYNRFWTIYHRPPKGEYRNYLLERRDSLIPLDERSFKGAFYTPLNVVEKCYEKLEAVLGKNWQKEYLVWDMCCGVGNLEVKHNYLRNVFMSTLDKPDVDVMKAAKICVGATRFQYDYLNDDITDDGKIDYALTKKLPENLREAIAKKKKILVLMNPPYAEAGNTLGKISKGKVAETVFSQTAMSKYGKASNELFTQFLARIAQEIPSALIATFGKLKYVNAPNFAEFRNVWNAKYRGGFIVHSKAFDSLKGNFPIGFLIWQTQQSAKIKTPITEISADILDKNAVPIGEKKFYNLPIDTYLNLWVKRPKANGKIAVPLKNCVSVYDKKVHLQNWAVDAIAYMWCDSNDFQKSSRMTAIFSSVWGQGHGFYITPENLWQAAIVFSVRRLIKPTWINDRDQFLKPTKKISDEFKNDCLMWMLFNGSNLTASADDLIWNNKKWSIVNHFIPFTENEVDAPERFESAFMVDYLRDKKLSTQAKLVLAEGRKLWREYFSRVDERAIRDELKLNRADVGWYQIRKALEHRNQRGDHKTIDFAPFKTAYETLTEKLIPQVYELGFLRG